MVSQNGRNRILNHVPLLWTAETAVNCWNCCQLLWVLTAWEIIPVRIWCEHLSIAGEAVPVSAVSTQLWAAGEADPGFAVTSCEL